MRSLPFVVILAVASCLAWPAGAAQCTAQSGKQTAVLVELYTSEGCDSCPPADRWLSSLQANGFGTDKVVPLSLHVDYWDYIGWKDPYAKRVFATRQRKLADLKRAKIIYTPQVLLQGQDFRRWDSREFAETVGKLNRQAPRAKLGLALDAMDQRNAKVTLTAELFNPADRKDARVYLAAFENKLKSEVAAGENKGKVLPHDFVVREWLGPIEFDSSARIEQKRVLPLLPNADPKQSGIAAFVQDHMTGEVLQALMLPACSG